MLDNVTASLLFSNWLEKIGIEIATSTPNADLHPWDTVDKENQFITPFRVNGLLKSHLFIKVCAQILKAWNTLWQKSNKIMADRKFW
jgi:hypothetical protein